jgi:hypothetical protein
MVAAAANIVAGMAAAILTNAQLSLRLVRSLSLRRSAWFADRDFAGIPGGIAAGPTEAIRLAIERKWVICLDGQITHLSVQPSS